MQVVAPAPVMEVGLQVNALSWAAGGWTVTLVFRETPAASAVTTAAVALDTAPPVALKTTALDPAGRIVDSGTVSAEALLEIETTVPPDGAGTGNCAVQIEIVPRDTVAGVQVSDEEIDGFITCIAPPAALMPILEPKFEAATV